MTLVILSSDPGTARSLVSDIKALGKPCIVASSIAQLDAIDCVREQAIVLVDRDLDDAEYLDISKISAWPTVATFGRRRKSGPPLGDIETAASYRFRFPLERHDIAHLVAFAARSSHAPPDRAGPTRFFRGLVGNSMQIRELRTRVNRIAQSESPVLIVGEAGTGKENVARNIHYRSARHAGPFVSVNCSAIPGELLESELFGHRKGAFSGAVSDRDGRLALASGGTLFLDEVADLPVELQKRMLSVLDEKVAHRVGCREAFPVTARLVAATRCDLEESVRQGDFRKDLLTRLGAYLIHVPGLRERKEDIPQLAAEIGFQIQRELGKSIVLSPESVACLRMHDWPGNLRELTNLIERLAALRPDGIARVADLPVEYQPENKWPEGRIQALHELDGQRTDLAEVMRYTEATLIRQAIDQADGGIAQAATILNISPSILIEKIELLGLEDFLATRGQS